MKFENFLNQKASLTKEKAFILVSKLKYRTP